jgi:hypothetical protein
MNLLKKPIKILRIGLNKGDTSSLRVENFQGKSDFCGCWYVP